MPCVFLQLMPETLFLTANLIDRFLEKKRVSRRNLQLVRAPLCTLWCPSVLRHVQPVPLLLRSGCPTCMGRCCAMSCSEAEWASCMPHQHSRGFLALLERHLARDG